MADKKLNYIQNYITCLFQVLAKNEPSDMKSKLKSALANYAYNIIHSTHLEENKKKELLNEIIYVLDKDSLSDDQFKEEVNKIRSSDEVRHFLKNALKANLKEDYENENYENKNDTFDEIYDENEVIDDKPSKRKLEDIKLYDSRKQKNNIRQILKKIVNYIQNEDDNDLNLHILKPFPNAEISYFHREYPFEERDLIGDLIAMFEKENEIIDEIPEAVLLTLLDNVERSLKSSDISKLPNAYVRNLKELCAPYAHFETCKFF